MFSESPAGFKPLSSEEVSFIKVGQTHLIPEHQSQLVFIQTRKKHKDQNKKMKTDETTRRKMPNSDTRVVQSNLVFVSGLPTRIADPELLKRPEYFGKFGKIHRIIINQGTETNYLLSSRQQVCHI